MSRKKRAKDVTLMDRQGAVILSGDDAINFVASVKLMKPAEVMELVMNCQGILWQKGEEPTTDVQRRLSQEISRSICVETPGPKTTALHPFPENPPKWAIGIFGSVWCDFLIDNKLIRVNIHEGRFYGSWLDDVPDTETKEADL